MFDRKIKQNQLIIGVLVFLALFALYYHFFYSSQNQCPTLHKKIRKPALKKPALPPSSYNASKSMIRWHQNHCRRLKGKKFCDPYFMIIGAPKCGTTSLYAYFVNHPNIYPPVTKEVRYFNFFNYSRDYIEFFEVPSKINMRKDMITFEASTNYLLNSHTSKTISVFQRIAESIPDVKLIALLRNPVDRFMSHYNYRLIQVKLPPLQQKIDMDIKQLHDCYERKKDKTRCLLTNRGVNLDENLIVKSIYVEKFRQLYKWFPKEQVRAYISEQLFSNPAPLLTDMHKFLDIPVVGPADVFNKVLPQVETQTRSSKNITKFSLNPQQRSFLCEFYRPFNEELVKLLGLKEYPWNC